MFILYGEVVACPANNRIKSRTHYGYAVLEATNPEEAEEEALKVSEDWRQNIMSKGTTGKFAKLDLLEVASNTNLLEKNPRDRLMYPGD